uniref:NR LBD domain-containing protein n=1 Tax=Elaeophora elaphi TaxID=1147741 RepID=A0A0R3RYR7_9BILA
MKCITIVQQYMFAEILFQLYCEARIDYSFDFRLQNDTICEQLLIASLEVNMWKFSDLPTEKQTATLLTAMPYTVSVTDVTKISKEFLSDIQRKMSRLAYICEVEHDDIELCEAMISLYKRWKNNPLAEIANDTLAYIKSAKEKVLTDEDVEIVIDFFLQITPPNKYCKIYGIVKLIILAAYL